MSISRQPAESVESLSVTKIGATISQYDVTADHYIFGGAQENGARLVDADIGRDVCAKSIFRMNAHVIFMPPWRCPMNVTEIWERWKSSRALARELSSLDMGQREELARDVCVSQDTLERLVSAGGRGNELERLMCALSLDVENIALSGFGAVTRDMGPVCSECLMTSRCRREPETGSASTNYNEYCPNALTLDALLEEEARSRLAFQMTDRR
jgi:hypothetical protein